MMPMTATGVTDTTLTSVSRNVVGLHGLLAKPRR